MDLVLGIVMFMSVPICRPNYGDSFSFNDTIEARCWEWAENDTDVLKNLFITQHLRCESARWVVRPPAVRA